MTIRVGELTSHLTVQGEPTSPVPAAQETHTDAQPGWAERDCVRQITEQGRRDHARTTEGGFND